MPEYRLTPSAKSDLIEIWHYTAETWGEQQAEKYLKFNVRTTRRPDFVFRPDDSHRYLQLQRVPSAARHAVGV
jgi:hypothetical protein